MYAVFLCVVIYQSLTVIVLNKNFAIMKIVKGMYIVKFNYFNTYTIFGNESLILVD